MSYNVELTQSFKKEIKQLLKKFPSLAVEISELIDTLENDPFQGVGIGNNCYKIRLAISSKGKGKSGGGRVITHIHIVRNTIYLLSIYDKSEQDSIDKNELNRLIGLIQ